MEITNSPTVSNQGLRGLSKEKGGTPGSARHEVLNMDAVADTHASLNKIMNSGVPGAKLNGRGTETGVSPVTSLVIGGGFPKRTYMSPEEWGTVEDNPRQRDTARHAARADHLKIPHPIHSFVNMAVLPDGRRYKLDGHTRGFLWSSGEVEAPAVLVVETWACESLEQVKELYGVFDNVKAVETGADRVFGAYREHGLEFKSPLLRNKKITIGCRVAYGVLFSRVVADKQSEYSLIRYWKPELYLLDEVDASQHVFSSAITAASLITFRRYGRDATDFWYRLAHNNGNKQGDVKDAVQALYDRIKTMREKAGITSASNINELFAAAIAAFQAGRRGQHYVGGIKGLGKVEIDKFATAAKSTTRTW